MLVVVLREDARVSRAAPVAAASPPNPIPGSEQPPGAVTRTVERWREGVRQRCEDAIAEEVPVALSYNGTAFAVMMLTPTDLDDFALGFSLTEGIVSCADEVRGVRRSDRLEGIELDIAIPDERVALLARNERTLEGRSGCGLCGSRRLEQVLRHHAEVGAGPRVGASALHEALDAMRDRQRLNRATGATHAAAWADVRGRVAVLREDVGRHNALDKLVGALVRQGFDPDAGFLLLTSRASYEMVMKAASTRIAFVAAVSGATALAVSLAQGAGITLLGYARRSGCTVYSRHDRYLGETP